MLWPLIHSALQKNLAAVYLFSGDEPLQLGELGDAVRQAAKRAGIPKNRFHDEAFAFHSE